MAVSRRARLARTLGPAAAARPVPPTPQTRTKLRPDVVAGLVARGRLAPHHADAAIAIRATLEAVGRGMFPTSQLGIGPAAQRGRRGGHDFLDRMTADERRSWERRYLPWTRAMALTVAAGLPGVRWLQLVLDMVVDNASPREVERRYRLRHGAAVGYLRQGLALYGT